MLGPSLRRKKIRVPPGDWTSFVLEINTYSISSIEIIGDRTPFVLKMNTYSNHTR